VKCPQCGYQNKPDAISCNLCRAVLKKERAESKVVDGKPATGRKGAAPPRKTHQLVRAGAPPIELEPGKLFTIGRQPTCSLAVPSNRVSRLHAEIKWEGDLPIIVDKGSSNGTFVGGKQIKEHALATGDELEIGPFHCVYRFEDPDVYSSREGDPNEGTATIVAMKDFLSGQISESGILEMLQGFEFNRKTGTLEIFGKDLRGWLTIVDGVPYAAEAETAKDEDAVYAILGVTSGRFTFLPQVKTQERRMKLTITAILLEAGRRTDEHNMGQTHGDE
jgi:hypothetical protein